jgi:superfamily II DNA or RNA helicase
LANYLRRWNWFLVIRSTSPRKDCIRASETGCFGWLRKKQRQAVTERLAGIPRQEARAILATGKYVGEGFDDPRLDTLFLTLPVSWRGTIAQYAGRLHRLYDGKREVRIYDYADLNLPMLARMFDRRCRGYEQSATRFSFRPAPSRAGPQM